MIHLALLAALGAFAQEPQYELAPPPPEDHVTFSSDHFDYDKSSAIMHLKGHVIMHESTLTIKTDEAWMNTESRDMKATGFLEMVDDKNRVTGTSGTYCFGTSTGVVNNAIAGYAPWNIKAKKAKLEPSKKMRFYRATFTSCDEEPSHYHFWSTYMKVRPQKYLTAYNTVFFIKKVPIFYTPFMFKSLKPDHFVNTRVSPGYDNRNGTTIKTVTNYRHGDLFGKTYVDDYGHHGLGFGTEFQMRNRETRAGFTGYRVNDHWEGRQRWAAFGDLYQQLPSTSSLQVRLEALSDPDFNNHFARANLFRVNPTLSNSAALTHTEAWGTTRMSWSRTEIAVPPTPQPDLQRYFVKGGENVPTLGYSAPSLKIPGIPLVHSLSATADSVWQRDAGFLKKTVAASWGASRSFKLGPMFSFSPRMGLGENYVNRRDQFSWTRALKDAIDGSYSVGGNLRLPTYVMGDWDLSHNYSERFNTNSFRVPRGAADHGVADNTTTLTDVISPVRGIFTRFSAGYNWQNYRDRKVYFRDRFLPWIVDFNLTPSKYLNIAMRDVYKFTGGNQAYLVQADYGIRGGRFIGFGFNNDASSPEHYYTSNEFGWASKSTGTAPGVWRLIGAVRSDVTLNGGLKLQRGYFFEKEFRLERNLHDFHTKLILRSRPGGVGEIQFQIELLIDQKRKPAEPPPAPWRAWDDPNNIR